MHFIIRVADCKLINELDGTKLKIQMEPKSQDYIAYLIYFLISFLVRIFIIRSVESIIILCKIIN